MLDTHARRRFPYAVRRCLILPAAALGLLLSVAPVGAATPQVCCATGISASNGDPDDGEHVTSLPPTTSLLATKSLTVAPDLTAGELSSAPPVVDVRDAGRPREPWRVRLLRFVPEWRVIGFWTLHR